MNRALPELHYIKFNKSIYLHRTHRAPPPWHMFVRFIRSHISHTINPNLLRYCKRKRERVSNTRLLFRFPFNNTNAKINRVTSFKWIQIIIHPKLLLDRHMCERTSAARFFVPPHPPAAAFLRGSIAGKTFIHTIFSFHFASTLRVFLCLPSVPFLFHYF